MCVRDMQSDANLHSTSLFIKQHNKPYVQLGDHELASGD
jgi:hypothetical protein